MDDKDLSKIANTIIYILLIVLICLILYNLILLFKQDNPSSQIPKNSIEASPNYIQET